MVLLNPDLVGGSFIVIKRFFVLLTASGDFISESELFELKKKLLLNEPW